MEGSNSCAERTYTAAHAWPSCAHVRLCTSTAPVYASLPRTMSRTFRDLREPVAGIGDAKSVELSMNEAAFESHEVGRAYDVRLQLTMPAESVTTVVVRSQ